MQDEHAQSSDDQRISTASAAAILGVHPQTLRRYEREGRLKPADRTLGGHRRYRRADVLALAEGGDQS